MAFATPSLLAVQTEIARNRLWSWVRGSDMKKLVFAHEVFSAQTNIQSVIRNTAVTAGYTEQQIVFVSDTKGLRSEVSSAMDELCVFLSQTFDGKRWEADIVAALRKLPTRNVVRVVLLINRPREDVFEKELRSYLDAEVYDVYFFSEVNKARALLEIASRPATPDYAYKYLGLETQRASVSRVGHVPPKDAIDGVDKDKKKPKKVSLKKYVFSAPVEETVVRNGVRRLVAVASPTGETGASALALNLALAISATGQELAYQEFPPVTKYYIDNFLKNDIVQPVQHAVSLYRDLSRTPVGENVARGIVWYYEQSRGIALSTDWMKGDFYRKYFSLPREELPILLDVGSAFPRLAALGVEDCVTDVVIAVRIDRLESSIERMNSLLISVANLGIRPLIVVLDSEPKDLPYFKDYDVFFVNTEKADQYGVYIGAQEELSPIITKLRLSEERIPDAPQAVVPETVVIDQLEGMSAQSAEPAEAEPKSKTSIFKSIFNREPKNKPAQDILSQAAEPEVTEPAAAEPLSDTERSAMQTRITELEQTNTSLSNSLTEAYTAIERQNHIITEECVTKQSFDALLEQYYQVKDMYEGLQASSEAAGRDRESLSTAVSERDTQLAENATLIGNLQTAVETLQNELMQRNGTVTELNGQLTEKDQIIASLQSGSSTAATQTQSIINERDSLRSRVGELENDAALSKSILESKDGEISSLREQLTTAQGAVAAAEQTAVDKRKELEAEYQKKMEELTEAMANIQEESSGDKQRLLDQLQEAENARKSIEANKDAILQTARLDAERIRGNANIEAAKIIEDARTSLTKEHEALSEKLQSAEELRLEADRKISDAEEKHKEIVKAAEEEAERLKDASLADVANRSAEVESLRQQAEDRIAAAAVEADRIIAKAREHEDALLEREAGLDNREHELKLERKTLDSQKEQLIQDQVAFGAEKTELARQKKDLDRREKEISSKEEDAKDRQAKRAEKERRSIAKAAERADLHRMKMEERKNGSASGLTFVLCLTVLAIAFGFLLFLVYKKGNDEVKDLRNRLDGIESASATVLAATKDLPEGSIVTMSDFVEVTITTDDVSDYVTSFSGTLTLTKPLTKGQCLTKATFEEGGGSE